MERYQDIRDGVASLCRQFDGQYWRELDAARAYPVEFVQALSEHGYLAALIPEEYGGSGLPLSAACAILEEIQLSGGNAGAHHRQMLRTFGNDCSAVHGEKPYRSLRSGEAERLRQSQESGCHVLSRVVAIPKQIAATWRGIALGCARNDGIFLLFQKYLQILY